MKKLPIPLPYLLIIIGFIINTINYGLLTKRINIFGLSGHENIAYIGLVIVVSGVVSFFYLLKK